MGAGVEHNTTHSHLPTCECFGSRHLCCDLFEHVAKVIHFLCHMGTIPPFDTSHIQIFLFSRWSTGRVAVVRCAIFKRVDVLHWSHVPEMHEEVAEVLGAMQRGHELSKWSVDRRVLVH